MVKYEYIRIQLDMGDLDELNRLASVGFRVVSVFPNHFYVDEDEPQFETPQYALLERPLPESTKTLQDMIDEIEKANRI
jgi:hypothetical protein